MKRRDGYQTELLEVVYIEGVYYDPDGKPLDYRLPNGKFVCIGKKDLSFFGQLQTLPARTKIEMMGLSAKEMLDYIEERNRNTVKRVRQILEQKWYWKETGDEAELLPEFIPEVNLPSSIILKKLKKKPCPFSEEQLNAIIDFYTGDRSHVYRKNENE